MNGPKKKSRGFPKLRGYGKVPTHRFGVIMAAMEETVEMVRRVELPRERILPGAKKRMRPNEYWQEHVPFEIRARNWPSVMTDAGENEFRQQLGLDKPPMLPSTGTDEELVDCVEDFLAQGGLIRDWCRMAGVSEGKVRKAIAATGREAAVAEARRIGADSLAEEALAIASTPVKLRETTEVVGADGEVIRTEIRESDALAARRLAYQARVTLAAKWAPDKYGEKIEVKTDGSVAGTIAAFKRRLRPQNEVTDVDPVR